MMLKSSDFNIQMHSFKNKKDGFATKLNNKKEIKEGICYIF